MLRCRLSPQQWLHCALAYLSCRAFRLAAAQFVGSGASLIYTAPGLLNALQNPETGIIAIEGSVTLAQSTWPSGGVVLTNRSLTIAGVGTATLDFGFVPGAIALTSGSTLQLANLTLQNATSLKQPLPTTGVFGYKSVDDPFWPSIILEPKSLLVASNITQYYTSRTTYNTPEQWVSKLVFSAQNQGQADAVTQTGPVTFQLNSGQPLIIPITNATTNATLGSFNLTGIASTFICVNDTYSPQGRQHHKFPWWAGLILGLGILTGLLAVSLAALVLILQRQRRRRQQRAEAHRVDADKRAGGTPMVNSNGPLPQNDTPLGRESAVRITPPLAQPPFPYPRTSMGAQSAASMQANMQQQAEGNSPCHASHGSSLLAEVMAASEAREGVRVLAPPPLSARNSGADSLNTTTSEAGGMPSETALQSAGHLQKALQMRLSSGQSAAASTMGGSVIGSGSPPGTRQGPVFSSQHLDPRLSAPGQPLVGTIPMPPNFGGSGESGPAASSPAQSLVGTISMQQFEQALDPPSMGASVASWGTLRGTSPHATNSRDPYSSMRPLLRQRSDAPLEGVELGPLLGRGSYGRVFKGRWKGAIVAIKVIDHRLKGNDMGMDIQRESMLSTSIVHPNVVSTYKVCTASPEAQKSATRVGSGSQPSGDMPDGNPAAGHEDDEELHHRDGARQQELQTWMLLEYCDRGSLERAIEQKRFSRKADGLQDMNAIYRTLLDIAAGMDYLHSSNVLHGDLKSANVLLKSTTTDPRGFLCKLADFGLSRVLDMDATHISTKTYGTISYMPAELLSQGKLTRSADVYSFAMLMWEIYTSQALFAGMSVGQVFYMVVYEGFRPPIPESTPAGYAELMQQCWHSDPLARPPFDSIMKSLQTLYTEIKRQSRGNSAATAAAGQSPVSVETPAAVVVQQQQGASPFAVVAAADSQTPFEGSSAV